MTAYNKNNSAVKRIMQEAKELSRDPSTEYTAAPLEDNLFDWHCTLRGPPGTEFEGGLYHFRIVLPAEYPFKAPSLMILTPSGRFEVNTKICISFTNYHEELWQPAWGVRTAIVGLQGFFPLKGTAAVGVGSLEAPASERRRLAKLSREWVCPHCNASNLETLPDPPAPTESSSPASSGNGGTDIGSAEGGQVVDPMADSSQAPSPDTRVGQSAGRQQMPTGASAAVTSSDSQLELQASQTQASDFATKSPAETPIQQIEQKEGASANDESPSRSSDDGSSPLEAGSPGVVELSTTSSSSTHSMSTSSSQAPFRNVLEVENETGVRQRAVSAMNSSTGSSVAARQEGHHVLGSPVSHSSSSPSRRSLLLLDGAIVMLLVWVGALVSRKLL